MGDKPKILMVYTGGTIGMVKDSSSGALKPLISATYYQTYLKPAL